MHAKEPEQYNSNPASLDHGSSDDADPTAALNNHLLGTEGWAEKITKQQVDSCIILQQEKKFLMNHASQGIHP